jgi:Ca2+-binding EF-hand superfamily protein
VKDLASRSLMTDKSRMIFKHLHLKRLRELFDSIDGDKDGEISENSFLQAQIP